MPVCRFWQWNIQQKKLAQQGSYQDDKKTFIMEPMLEVAGSHHDYLYRLTPQQQKEVDLVEFIKDNNFPKVKQLLDEGVNPNAVSIGAGNFHALYVAIVSSSANIVAELLKRGANQPDQEICLQATQYAAIDKKEKIALLVKHNSPHSRL